MDIWSNLLGQGFDIDTICLDFQKAFDKKFLISGLVYKLQVYGINEKRLINWSINGQNSSWKEVTSVNVLEPQPF